MAANSDLRICSIDGCGGKHHSGGLCGKHYVAHRRKLGIQPVSDRTCGEVDCTNDYYAKGRCKRHYTNARPSTPYRYDPRRKKGCLFAACNAKHYLDGVCARHYRGGRVDIAPLSYDPSHTNLVYKYGITREERDSLFLAQDGLCSICRVAAATHIDHDHAHGCSDNPKRGCRDCVRGGVCSRCNTSLAFHEGYRQASTSKYQYVQRLIDDPWWRARANFYLRARPFSETYRKEAA